MYSFFFPSRFQSWKHVEIEWAGSKVLTNEKNTFLAYFFLLNFSFHYNYMQHKWLAYEYRKLMCLFLEIIIFKQIRQYTTKAACMQVHFYTVSKYVFLWTILISISFQFQVSFLTWGLQSSCVQYICELYSKKEVPLSKKSSFNCCACGGFKVKQENSFIVSPFQWFKIKNFLKRLLLICKNNALSLQIMDFHDLLCSI